MKLAPCRMRIVAVIPVLLLLGAVSCYDKSGGAHLLADTRNPGEFQDAGTQSRPASGPTSRPTSRPANPSQQEPNRNVPQKPPVPKREGAGRDSGKTKLPSTQALVAVLKKVVHGSRVDYKAVAQSRASLETYLAGVQQADLGGTSREAKLAFYINAYNVSVLLQVLDKVIGKGPKGADLSGVLAVPGKPGFFDAKSITVSGELMSLNELESRGRKLGDPRIHFAVNCASMSCPALLNRPWSVATLGRDLDEATRRYFASPHGLVVADGQVKVTQLLKWYAKDFGGKDGATRFVQKHAPASALAAVKSGIDGYLDYDWALNRR